MSQQLLFIECLLWARRLLVLHICCTKVEAITMLS